ncbi:MAG: maltose acetyltransferase domain-containing protein, partial [Cetobacterium sp.]
MKTEKEKMIAGEMYSPMDEQLFKDREVGKRFCKEYNSTDDTDYETRKNLM